MTHSNIKATREGLAGKTTASGYVIDKVVPFVALPSCEALHRFVRITNRANERSCLAIVLDVGPWNTHDEAYVMGGARPQSESGVSVSGLGTNKAGIDLSDAVWHQLGMQDNGLVDWEFLIA